MTRVDLDQVQARREAAEPAHYRLAVVPEELLDDVDATIAELRASREVIQAAAATIYRSPEYRPEAWVALEDALAAYEQVVGS